MIGMKNRPVVVLLTDFGLKDTYAGILKGVIASISPGTNVIDLSHEVLPQDILQGSFLLAASFSYFPRGSVFCVVVDPVKKVQLLLISQSICVRRFHDKKKRPCAGQ